ncbi:exosortase family protein XrtF [uncultured Flavobacterium sp.]|uniref:exosortase family protein XrtF n=1 Tax=uncultured Flavobacterium sp. TaxID=165435 RepID=UPI0030C85F95
MKEIFIQYKPFFTFLIKFVLFYFVFAYIYNQFLDQFDVSKFELDSITKMVSSHTSYLMHLFGENYSIIPNNNEASMKVIYNGKYVARIIEGCNAISVIILFAAFIFAFASNWKKTFLYIIVGAVLVYILNVVRIGLLVWAIYYYPAYEEFLHGTVFPLFIYGVVFILWVIWVTKFSKYAK